MLIRERLARNRKIAAAVIAVLMLGGGTATWMFFRENTARVEVQRELLDAKALALKLLSANPARTQAPGEAESLAKTIEAIAAGATTDDRYAQALALLKQGKTAEAAALLEASAKDAETATAANNKRAAASYRQLAQIAAVADPGKARGAYAQAARLDPDNVEGLLLHGNAQMDAGNLGEAETAYRRVIALGQPGKDDLSLYRAQLGLGDIASARGSLPNASFAYDQAAAIAARSQNADTSNATWRQNLSTLYLRRGDVAVAQGKLAEALSGFREAMAIRESLTKADPGNARWRRDLAISHNKIGDVLVAQGKLAEAQGAFREAMAIRESLTKADPGNAEWRRDLSVSHEKIGDVLVAQGKLAEALAAFREAMAIRESLAKADPGNAGWRRDLSVSHEKIGDVLVAQGKLAEALAAFREAMAIGESLAKADPGNAGWRRDLAVSHAKLGNAYLAANDKTQARRHLAEGRTIIADLVAKFPNWTQWKSDLAWFDAQLAGLK